MTTELIAFIKKETWHIIRDKRTVMIMLILPIIMMILFGFAIRTDVDNVKIAVIIPHNSEMIRKQIAKLESNPHFIIVGSTSNRNIDDVFRKGEADAIIEFAKDYDRIMSDDNVTNKSSAVQFIVDASNSNTAMTIASYLNEAYLNGEMVVEKPVVNMLYNPEMKSAYNFVPGIMGLIFILICTMMTSVSIVREKETGTMEVILISPVKTVNIIAAKMIPYFLLSCINLATILIIAKFMLGVPLSGNLTGIIFLSLLYIVLSLTLGILISLITTKQSIALIVSGMLMMMPCMILSGMLFPLENIPWFLKWLSYIIPARWYIDAMKKLMIEGTAFSAVLIHTIIMSCMIIINVTASLLTFKDKLD